MQLRLPQCAQTSLLFPSVVSVQAMTASDACRSNSRRANAAVTLLSLESPTELQALNLEAVIAVNMFRCESTRRFGIGKSH